MKRNIVLALAAAGLFGAHAAQAHIYYYDLNQGQQIKDLTAAGKAYRGNDLPIADSAYWNSTYQITTSSGEAWSNYIGNQASGSWSRTLSVVNLDSSGWTDGLRTDTTQSGFLYGDSHKVDFASFHLSEGALVTIRLSDDMGGSGYGLNPSFSLYRGAIVYDAHDGAAVDPLNPKQSTPPFNKVQNGKDSGSTVDSQGITSAYRDTLTNGGSYAGQFNALGGWSQGNEAGDWSAVEFVTAVTGYANASGDWSGNSNMNELVDFYLPAGDYIIAFSGNAQPLSYATARSADSTSPYGTLTNLGGTLFFGATAAPVPEPETWAMLLAGLGLIGFAARRKRSA